jgi:hypothetical protein
MQIHEPEHLLVKEEMTETDISAASGISSERIGH